MMVRRHRIQVRRSIVSNQRGVTAVEFALIAPTFLILLLGMLDIGQMVYAQSVLNGAVQLAAREASLENGDTAAADAMVLSHVDGIMPGVTLESTRRSYYDFADIERAERWNDADGNGRCDDGEAYTDENDNGQWDADIGRSGNGGASDAVIYTVRARYDSLFRTPFTPAAWATRTLVSSVIRKNQPFASQAAYSSDAGTCN
jgi:Flp pilus assembly pilin Flp